MASATRRVSSGVRAFDTRSVAVVPEPSRHGDVVGADLESEVAREPDDPCLAAA